MGGDDVGSDDECYLNPDVGPPSDSEEESGNEEEEYEGRKSRNKKLQKKRSRAQVIEAITGDQGDDSDGGDDGKSSNAIQSASNKKSKTTGSAGPASQRKLLLEAARGISKEKSDVQAAFLWTCYTHGIKMRGQGINEDDKFTADQFYDPSAGSKKKNKNQQQPKKQKNAEPSMATFLKGGALTSMKRLKKWKYNGSPMVIIVCLSARRAVQILKQLSPLNVRAGKLFAKHMDFEEQVAMLKSNSFGIAVGTPNRLLKLFDGGSEEGKGALTLDGTELLVIDNQEDSKSFTVCTMNDTAPDLMQFLDRAVLPQLRKRQTLKLAMF